MIGRCIHRGFVFLAAASLLCGAVAGAQTAGNEAGIDPRGLAGADIGAKVNTAIASMPPTGGTVRIPAGSYSFATTIKLTRAGQHLKCDAGAVLHYTGSGDAIVIDPARGPGLELDIDGEGGCKLMGTAAAENGIRLMPGNTFSIRGMRISGFSKGNGIEISGANSVQIVRNAIQGNAHGIDMVTIPHFAPNAIHVMDNEIYQNGWGVTSRNGHAPATRALANVYRDNVFEGNSIGDISLGWDAHTLVEGNYFESRGVGVAAGTDLGGSVFDIHIARNYFTVNGAGGYRSEIELGAGTGFFIEGNYEEGPAAAAGSGCAINVTPTLRGSAKGVVLRDAFLRTGEGKISTHEFCYEGKPEIPPGVFGDTRLAGNLSINGGVQLSGPLHLSQGAVASTDAAIKAGAGCTTEGMLLISRPANQAARLFFCSGFRWQPVVPPHP